MNFVARNIHRENSLAVKGERARRRKFATRRLKAERQKTRTRVNAILDQKFEEKRVAAGNGDKFTPGCARHQDAK